MRKLTASWPRNQHGCFGLTILAVLFILIRMLINVATDNSKSAPPLSLADANLTEFEIFVDYARRVSIKFEKVNKHRDREEEELHKLLPRHAKFIFTPPMFGGLGNQVS